MTSEKSEGSSVITRSAARGSNVIRLDNMDHLKETEWLVVTSLVGFKSVMGTPLNCFSGDDEKTHLRGVHDR